MNILFMSLGAFNDLSQGSVHIDLVKRFAEEHTVFLVCKHEGEKTELTVEYGINVLRVHTGALKKIGLIKKGINTILVEAQFKNAIKKYFGDTKFDLVLYTTPPITFVDPVKYIKKRDNAATYLMLKDIFPQNAVDIGMMKTSGFKGVLYKHFRKKEKDLYKLSDFIGCMSPANKKYILSQNPEIDPDKVEICPNATVIEDKSVSREQREELRKKYNIPLNSRVYVYGGNLGKPQGISFLIECLKKQREADAFFLVIGQGTEYPLLEKFMKTEATDNCRLMEHLRKDDFEMLVAACDIGMIFLDYRFTIPNFPSRLLSYMKAKIPVLAVTDANTDVGTIISENGFGWYCESNDASQFLATVNSIQRIPETELVLMKEKEFAFLKENYSVDNAYDIIMGHFK